MLRSNRPFFILIDGYSHSPLRASFWLVRREIGFEQQVFQS